MSEELQNQGLQQDGESLEPSQTQEGNDPVPSQEETGQLTDQQLEQILPDQDERGVSAENVLSEVLRKVNKLTEDINTLRSTQTQSFQQPYQQPNSQSQTQQHQRQFEKIIPRSPDEIAEIVNREAQEKYGEAFRQGTVDYWELQKFQTKRFAELNSLMTNSTNAMQSERINSENRILGLYPDLNNPNSNLSQAVIRELNRRASLSGIDFQSYYTSNPYCLESIAPSVAIQLGISAKTQNQPRIVSKQPNLPPNNFQGKQTQVKEEDKPTQADIEFGKRFKIDPKSLIKARKKSSSDAFVDESGMLYS